MTARLMFLIQREGTKSLDKSIHLFLLENGEIAGGSSVEIIHEQKMPGRNRPGDLIHLAGDRHADGHMQTVEHASTD